MNLVDVQNPAKTSVRNFGTWSRVTPWLPWILRGQAPGHTQYQSMTNYYPDIGHIKKPVRDYLAKNHPQMLEPPPRESWSKPNLSSLEVYAKTEKPAPAPKPKT